MRLILSAILAVSLLGGCAARVKGPEAEVVVPAISVDSGPRSSGGGGFCPPGQAKKGRC